MRPQISPQETAFLEAWRNNWVRIDRSAIYDWGRKNVYLPNAYAIEGWFHVEKSLYLKTVFDAILDDTVREVTFQKGIQIGGSLVGDVAVCYTICNRPQNIYWNFPTNEKAEDYWNRRVEALLEACPPIAGKFAKMVGKDRHNKTKMEIHFPAMWIALQGANLRNLQSHSVPMIINEELWEWDPGMYLEAAGRTAYFSWRSKIINISQAGDAGSQMDQRWKAGTQEELEVACPHCRTYQMLYQSVESGQFESDGRPKYAGLTWDKPKDWNMDALMRSARYVCMHCLQPWRDEPVLRRHLIDYCRYSEPKNPNATRSHRSLHAPSIICDQVPFGVLAKEFVEAKEQERVGNRDPIRAYYLKRWAISYDPSRHATYQMMPAIEVVGRPERFWEKQDFIFLLVDVQRDHFWVMADAWSAAGENMILWFGKCLTWQDVADKQREYGISNRCVFVDAFHRPNEVFIECTLHGEEVRRPEGLEWVCWNALRGDHRADFVWVPREGVQAGQRVHLLYSWPPHSGDPCIGMKSDDPLREDLEGKVCPLFYFAKGTIDNIAGERRDMMAAGITSYVAKGPWLPEFSKQMQGEQKKRLTNNLGHTVEKWEYISANHALDCYRMGIAAAGIAGIVGTRRV